jgi:hypothetical protein
MKNFNLKHSVKTIIGVAILVLWSISVQAQVTIGSQTSPVKGALLELKTKEASTAITHVTDAGNTTVGANGGGLGLPRVQLMNRKTLEPFIATDDAEWTDNATSRIKERHAGLTVYNLQVSGTNETNPDNMFRQGVYVWDGNAWSLLGEKKQFYMPSFNIEIDPDNLNAQTCDLYKEYQKQFDNSGGANTLFVSSNSNITTISSLENGRLYGKQELDYVITYYDSDTMENLTVDTDGWMQFDLKNLNFTEKTFINVVLVVK